MCIYHANCTDGFTAAWVVWKALGKDVEFVPGFYGTIPPDVKDKIVYIVDFSYKRPVMEQIVREAKQVIHIDHHDTAIKDMQGFHASNFEAFYSKDNTQSGAMLSWNYFYSEDPVPMLVQYVDDRDRWQFKLSGSREVQANLMSYEYTMENWDFVESQPIKEQIAAGAAINRRLLKDIKELSTVVVRRMKIAGYNIPVANVPKLFGSDMCMILAKNEPFAAYYYDMPNEREFGLRSMPDGIDVGKIANMFGGGGHEHASGFRVSYENARKFEV